MNYKLCGEGSCCPTVESDGTTVTITDDDGGTVKLTEEEFDIMFHKEKERREKIAHTKTQ